MSRTKSGPSFPLAEFGVLSSGLALFLYLYKEGASQATTLTALAFALCAWFLDYYRTRRPGSDFSGGTLYCLALALSGDFIAAVFVLVGSSCVRTMGGKASRPPWELVWLLPSLISLPLMPGTNPWKLAAVGLSLFVFSLGSRSLGRKMTRENKVRDAAIEAKVRLLRVFVLCLSPLALALPPNLLWCLILATPMLLALQQMVLSFGYRLGAEEGKSAQLEARRSHRELARVESRLGHLEEKGSLLEQLVQVFERTLTSQEAFVEFTRVTRSVVPFRSLVLFRLAEDGRLHPTQQDSPEADLLLKAHLTLRTEPLVERAWQQDSPLLGAASTESNARLLAQEKSLIAIPLKPFGVVYFGRSQEEPFSKAEARKLVFVAKRARASLVRVHKAEQSRRVLAEQRALSQELKDKVVFTSALLAGAQGILSSRSMEQLCQALENLVSEGVCGEFGLLLRDGTPEHHWGFPSENRSAVEQLASMVRAEKRSLYLNDLQKSKIDAPNSRLRSILVIPLQPEENNADLLFVGSSKPSAFTNEEQDFVGTGGYLIAAGMEALRLNSELKEAHQQVVQASKLSAIGRLAAGVAHELNTPLAAIGLALEAATNNPSRSAKKLQRATRALERAQDIVENLLEHSRRSGSERELLDVRAVLTGVRELVEAQLLSRHQKLVVSYPELESHLLANQTDIQQALINLIINSSDASEDHSEITLSASEEDATILLRVSDQGSGIPSEIRGKIFDPFFTTKGVGQGTGLGLSVCRELVERHHGQINFETEPNQGTVFSLRFPAMRS